MGDTCLDTQGAPLSYLHATPVIPCISFGLSFEHTSKDFHPGREMASLIGPAKAAEAEHQDPQNKVASLMGKLARPHGCVIACDDKQAKSWPPASHWKLQWDGLPSCELTTVMLFRKIS
eukprot:TRINITY_DN7633_c0_g1_i1.p2 TRINITY_DN7633_c0_g1~~TRINITY_DN7633_c0_g1_i1.p2  ORF type:complete len:119 (+),score=9.25 TRINITY_DN7633_c0_g1_i1:1801-2157(+)